MLVRELIAVLQAFPQDLPVLSYCEEVNAYSENVEVREASFPCANDGDGLDCVIIDGQLEELD